MVRWRGVGCRVSSTCALSEQKLSVQGERQSPGKAFAGRATSRCRDPEVGWSEAGGLVGRGSARAAWWMERKGEGHHEGPVSLGRQAV